MPNHLRGASPSVPLFVHPRLLQEVAFSVSCTAVPMCSGPFRTVLRDFPVLEHVDFALQCSGDNAHFLVFLTLSQLALSSASCRDADPYAEAVGLGAAGLFF